jgi:hypothetical protein
MPFLVPNSSIELTIPAAQSIRVSNPFGLPGVRIVSDQVVGKPGVPVIDVPATSGTTYGPYNAATKVTLINMTTDPVEYVVAASPVLSNLAYNPAAVGITGGTINGASVGATTRSTVAATTVSVNRTDSSGTPGNVTNNSASGRAAIAAAATSVVITNSSVAATDEIFLQLRSADATATIIRVTAQGAGTFTVTANAAATAATSFSFFVVKA